jgi:MinD-like ATPase involved in chromosome partitioning or flagellar assembly
VAAGLDFIIADMPPSSSAEMFSSFDTLKEKIFGVIIVSQPAQLSTIGLIRTIHLLKQRQIPILGLVANQDGFRTKEGRIEYQFLSPRADLQKICNETVISFDSLADTAGYGRPKTLKVVGVQRKIGRFVTTKILQ